MFFDVGMTDFWQTSDYNDQLDINYIYLKLKKTKLAYYIKVNMQLISTTDEIIR